LDKLSINRKRLHDREDSSTTFCDSLLNLYQLNKLYNKKKRDRDEGLTWQKLRFLLRASDECAWRCAWRWTQIASRRSWGGERRRLLRPPWARNSLTPFFLFDFVLTLFSLVRVLFSSVGKMWVRFSRLFRSPILGHLGPSWVLAMKRN